MKDGEPRSLGSPNGEPRPLGGPVLLSAAARAEVFTHPTDSTVSYPPSASRGGAAVSASNWSPPLRSRYRMSASAREQRPSVVTVKL